MMHPHRRLKYAQNSSTARTAQHDQAHTIFSGDLITIVFERREAFSHRSRKPWAPRSRQTLQLHADEDPVWHEPSLARALADIRSRRRRFDGALARRFWSEAEPVTDAACAGANGLREVRRLRANGGRFYRRMSVVRADYPVGEEFWLSGLHSVYFGRDGS